MRAARLLPVLTLFACTAETTESAPPREVMDSTDYDYFGAGVTKGDAVAATMVSASAEEFDGKTARVTGVIQQVCQNKGCWMQIGDSKQPIRVTFKDYGFFVPKDTAGKEVIVEGEVDVTELSVEEARHFAEDEGRHEDAKQINEPVPEIALVATGVAIRKQ